MYQAISIIRTCKNLNLTFPLFEFRPRVQRPVPTFKPASHPIITHLFAIVIGNPPRPCSFSPAIFLPLSFFYQQATNKMTKTTPRGESLPYARVRRPIFLKNSFSCVYAIMNVFMLKHV
jgi:hypothetical protein